METVSEGQISDQTTAQYRTVPWRPHNVSFNPDLIGPDSFEVSWSGPRELTEFDRYQVAIGIRRKTPQIIERGAPLKARFVENLKPGRTYQVVVKTVSGSVASWPATGNVTTRYNMLLVKGFLGCVAFLFLWVFILTVIKARTKTQRKIHKT